MGTIVDQNSDASANDSWALVSGTTVINTIVSNLAGIEAIQANYDYLVDLTIQGQTAGIGWTYSAQTDAFNTPPAPTVNWIETLETDFDNISGSLQQCLVDSGPLGGSVSKSDLAQAFAAATSDSSASYTPNQQAIMLAIYQYVLGGG
jgi:hypothetical protein